MKHNIKLVEAILKLLLKDRRTDTRRTSVFLNLCETAAR